MFFIGPAALILVAYNDCLIIINSTGALSHIMVFTILHHIIIIVIIALILQATIGRRSNLIIM